jgi:hypothetical protein
MTTVAATPSVTRAAPRLGVISSAGGDDASRALGSLRVSSREAAPRSLKEPVN